MFQIRDFACGTTSPRRHNNPQHIHKTEHQNNETKDNILQGDAEKPNTTEGDTNIRFVTVKNKMQEISNICSPKDRMALEETQTCLWKVPIASHFYSIFYMCKLV